MFMRPPVRTVPPVVAVVVVAWCASAFVGCVKPRRPDTERMGLGDRQDASAFPDARAVIVLDRTEVTIAAASDDARPVGEIVQTRRIQVLTEAGRELAKVLIPFDERTRVFSITGRTMKADGRVVEMHDAAVIDVDRFTQDQPAAALYDGPGYKMARAPEVEVGDAFEMTVVSRVRDPRWLPPLRTGGDLPMVRGEVVVDVQDGLDLDMRVTRNGRIVNDTPTRIPTTVKLLTETVPVAAAKTRGTRFVWVFEHTPAVFSEGAGASVDAMAISVHAVLRTGRDAFRSLNDIAAWYRELTRGMVDHSSSTSTLTKLAKGLRGGKSDKVRQIQRYVQDDIKDAPTFVHLAALPPHPPGEVIRTGVGDAKDQASLTIALLRAAGLDGLPLLVSREGSFASIPDLPTPAPFNHVVVAIPAGGSFSFIDPSTPGLPAGRLPPLLQGAVGVLVTPDGGELLTLPEDAPEANVVDVRYDLKLGADGTVTGQLRGSMSGVDAARAQRILELDGSKQAEALAVVIFGDAAGDPAAKRGMALGDVFRTASQTSNVKSVDESIKLQAALSPLRIGNVVVMDDLVGRPMAFLWREGRKSPVYFGARGTSTVRVDIALPPGLGIDALPVSIEKAGPLIHVQERWSVADGVLSFVRTVKTMERVVPASRYDELRGAMTASWARSQQPVRIVPGGDRGSSYGGDAF